MPNPTSRTRAARVAPTINVTPLVDVLLVLLILFMIAQPKREQKLPVTTPQPAVEDSPSPPEMLMLTVSEDFQLALNSQAIRMEELLPLLSRLMEERQVEARALFIKAPPRAAYHSVVLLIDLAKGAGVKTIGLLADES